jgi:hypothetical protein
VWCGAWGRRERADAAGTPRLNDALVQQMLRAADDDQSGDLDEEEFVHGIALELKRIRTITALEHCCTPTQVAFTIPDRLLEQPAEQRGKAGQLHLRMRLGVNNGSGSVVWDKDWQNPLASSSTFRLCPRFINHPSGQVLSCPPPALTTTALHTRDRHCTGTETGCCSCCRAGLSLTVLVQDLDELPPLMVMSEEDESKFIHEMPEEGPVERGGGGYGAGASAGVGAGAVGAGVVQAPGQLRHFVRGALRPCVRPF